MKSAQSIIDRIDRVIARCDAILADGVELKSQSEPLDFEIEAAERSAADFYAEMDAELIDIACDAGELLKAASGSADPAEIANDRAALKKLGDGLRELKIRVTQ